MKMRRFIPLLVAIALLPAVAPPGVGQTTIASSASSAVDDSPLPTAEYPIPDLAYRRPTEKMKLKAYLFDAYGPYSITGSAIIAGVNQAESTPPEWGQGGRAYGHRFGSNLAIAAVTTTARYGLAAAFREDTVYYRCECKGFFRRFGHAMISTVTARRGGIGHSRLSVPAIVAPYAGSMTAIYGWYPARYGPKDALRMGNYTLLAFAGENFALEFLYGGPHTLFSKLHRPALSGSYSSSSSSR
jgi:hypothetical protein